VLVEPFGADWIVTLRRGGMQMLAKMNGRPGLSPGQNAAVRLDMNHCYLFDGENGLTLGVAGPAG